MTPVCFRLDLDSTPWDASSGYGVEQARLVALFDFARRTGVKFHVFASSRALRASPGLVDAVLGDGHDLDWLCIKPVDLESQLIEATNQLYGTGHTWWGAGLVAPWPDAVPTPLSFVSAPDTEGRYLTPFETLRFSLANATVDEVVAAVRVALTSYRPIRTLRDEPIDPPRLDASSH